MSLQSRHSALCESVGGCVLLCGCIVASQNQTTIVSSAPKQVVTVHTGALISDSEQVWTSIINEAKEEGQLKR